MKLTVQNRGWSKILMLLCLSAIWWNGFAQDESLADSLIKVYESGDLEVEEQLDILSEIAYNLPDPDRILLYCDTLMREANRLGFEKYLFNAYMQKGNALQQRGDLSEALNSYYNAVEISSSNANQREVAMAYTALAAVYGALDNRKNVIQYYTDAIEIFEEVKDSFYYAVAMENLGDSYLEWSKPDSALLYFNQSGPLFEKMGNRIPLAYNLGNKGLAFAQKGLTERAELNIKDAVAILEEAGDYRPITTYLNYMSDIYADKEDWDRAFDYALRSLELAQQYGLKARISDAYLKMSELYERTGYATASLNYYRRYVAFRDSVVNLAVVQEMADIRRNAEKAQFEAELQLSNQQKQNQKILTIATAIALLLIAFIAIILYRRNEFTKRTNATIAKEMARSENLLTNILPEETAQELKEFGKVQAKKFESVTVLFTDFEAFTAASERVDPEHLVSGLGYYFMAFDKIIDKYGLEKIKTIGDSYMCAGGLPFPTEDHAIKMVQAALEILAFVKKAKSDEAIDFSFNIRIGINTGPLVAGVVGSKKFSYDIWGDSVNVASRMESHSERDRINISQNTYDLVKDVADCEYRGQIELKNRGAMKMYFVNGMKKDISI